MSRKPENPEARDEMHDETHHERRDAPARPAAGSLEGRILVAMPGLRDPRFAQTVIYLCAHTEDGAMGLIVNKPTLDLSFPDLLSQLDIDPSPEAERIRVHYGGPVETGRGFVLHSEDFRLDGATKTLGGGLGLTATVEILRAMAGGGGPKDALLALGYAGWAPGQLEQEIAENGWLDCPTSREVIFGADDSAKWAAAMRSIGVDPALLSSQGGRA